jgi:hypothetical protein
MLNQCQWLPGLCWSYDLQLWISSLSCGSKLSLYICLFCANLHATDLCQRSFLYALQVLFVCLAITICISYWSYPNALWVLFVCPTGSISIPFWSHPYALQVPFVSPTGPIRVAYRSYLCALLVLFVCPTRSYPYALLVLLEIPTGPIRMPYWSYSKSLLVLSVCPTGPTRNPYWSYPYALLALLEILTCPIHMPMLVLFVCPCWSYSYGLQVYIWLWPSGLQCWTCRSILAQIIPWVKWPRQSWINQSYRSYAGTLSGGAQCAVHSYYFLKTTWRDLLLALVSIAIRNSNPANCFLLTKGL